MKKRIIFTVTLIVIFIGVCPLIYKLSQEQRVKSITPGTTAYWQLLDRDKEIELFKTTHSYLCDMTYIPTSNVPGIHEVGYSRIWKVLSVTLQSNLETRMYIDVPIRVWEAFDGSGYDYDFFLMNIAPNYEYETPIDTNETLAEKYVTLY